MTAPALDLQPAVEAAAQALYEAAVVRAVRAGGNPLDYEPWEQLSPIVRNKYRQLGLPAVVAAVPEIARQAWDIGALAYHIHPGDPMDPNPWADDDLDEELRRLTQ